MKTQTALRSGPSTKAQASRAVSALAALAQETRLGIFRLLVEFAPTGLTPGAIALRLKLPPATLSFHLKELVNAGLVTQERDRRYLIYRAAFDRMNALLGYLTANCCRGEDCAVAERSVCVNC